MTASYALIRATPLSSPDLPIRLIASKLRPPWSPRLPLQSQEVPPVSERDGPSVLEADFDLLVAALVGLIVALHPNSITVGKVNCLS